MMQRNSPFAAAAKYVVVVARGAPDAKGSDEVRYGDSTGDDRGSERKRGGCTCCDLRLFCNELFNYIGQTVQPCGQPRSKQNEKSK